ncbi:MULTISPECIES: YgaB family protein [Bacillus]|uniref:YgaB family protein n=1 Tax=Bacillus TaxID=1386 RepID=UPI00065E7539|nr:YgaB family protein [Bacillus smithii]MED0658845.1 YgaB family protein [Bacillus smithii]MED4883474.1 YgaB family protein [Bacillus smithii]MED4926240.1 YgaB family protein [Bacillus smithii]
MMLDRFDVLVKEQMKTMEKLLLLQQEIERCQLMEKELKELQDIAGMENLESEMDEMRKKLKEIQKVFEAQTDEVIRTYQEQTGVKL